VKITLAGQFYRIITPFGSVFRVGAIAIGILILAETVGIITGLNSLAKTKRFLEAKRHELKTLESLKPNVPSEKRLHFFKEDAKSLSDLSDKIQKKGLFWPKLDYKDAERLEFKEEIFSLREMLRKKAETKKILFEKAAGLGNFDEILPESARLGELSMALALSKELRGQLIESGIARIEELNFPEGKTLAFGSGIERYDYSFILKLNANWASLSGLLSHLSDSGYLWGIERLVIQNKPILGQGTSEVPDAPLYADLVLKGTFFGRKNAHATV